MPWEARTNKAGNYGRPRKIGDTTLYSIFMTNYERNTETGEVRPTESANHKGAHYIEVPKDDPRFTQSEAFGAKNELGIPFTHRDNSNKTFLLVGYLDKDGKMQSSGNAGAALEQDYANYNAGKKPAYTTGLLQFAETQTVNGEATLLNAIEGITPVDSDGIPVADAEGTVGIDETAILANEEEDEEEDDDTDISPPAFESFGPIQAKSTASGLEGLPGKTVRYPNALISEQTDYLKIGIRAYKAVGESFIRDRSLGFLDSTTGQKAEDNKGYILLPIPANIQDTNAVKYTDGSMDALSAEVAKFATRTISAGANDDPIQKLQNAFKGAAEGIGSFTEDGTLQKLVTNSLASEALNALPGVSVTRDQLIARGSGGIINPNMELLFNGVTLRTFRFSFKLTPRNDTETKSIKTIIQVFKKNMAPKAAARKQFLSTPNIFDLQYMKGGKKHPFLNSFKSCALTDMSVNYTGDGTYATYHDGTPVSMIMDLTFKELEAVYDEDYDKVPSAEGVGF